MHKLASAALAVAFSASLIAAHAAGMTDTTNFKVKLTITESCKFLTTASATADVNFGTVARTKAAPVTDSAGKVTVNCSPGTDYSIGLTGGLHSTGSALAPAAGERQMLHATKAENVKYDLFQDAARSTFWGNTAGNMLSGTGDGSDQAWQVYGRTSDLDHSAGDYEDTVTATVYY